MSLVQVLITAGIKPRNRLAKKQVPKGACFCYLHSAGPVVRSAPDFRKIDYNFIAKSGAAPPNATRNI
jgi:hypothetical protein